MWQNSVLSNKYECNDLYRRLIRKRGRKTLIPCIDYRVSTALDGSIVSPVLRHKPSEAGNSSSHSANRRVTHIVTLANYDRKQDITRIHDEATRGGRDDALGICDSRFEGAQDVKAFPSSVAIACRNFPRVVFHLCLSDSLSETWAVPRIMERTLVLWRARGESERTSCTFRASSTHDSKVHCTTRCTHDVVARSTIQSPCVLCFELFREKDGLKERTFAPK